MGAPPVTDRTAVIIATGAELLEPLVTAAGYEVVGVSDSGVNGERLAAHFQPDVLVVENDLRGDPGWFVIPRLREVSADSKVLLVVTEDWSPRDIGSSGAFAVITRNRLGQLVEELTDLDAWIRAVQASAPGEGERRTGRDRRVHQDWTKVGWERREAARRTADEAA